MKLIVILYIGLGLVLSLAIGVEYNCEGPEMFPTYYGSPFVFKQTSLGSSMTYFYSISGLAMNTLVWSTVLFFVDKGVQKFKKKKAINIGYKIIVCFMIVFATVTIATDFISVGHGFNRSLNYWYLDMNTKANDWGMRCQGELIIFK